MGTFREFVNHNSSSAAYHLQFASNGFAPMMVEPDSATSREDSDDVERDSTPRTRGFRAKKSAADHQLSKVWSKIDALERTLNCQLEPLKTELTKFEGSLNDLQESFSELSLMVQTLQATSYNGEFVWKIPELARRVKEARSGITYSLYSAPFYTSRFGYKMCLRLYLNGDGSGKGTHLSFFLTIMKGEYDALLSWPFQHLVTLMLLDQDKRKNIVQAFRPEPSSSSFWQPKTEMNIASGCPRFAPLSVLSNPGYVRNDTIYFKAVIEGSGFDF